MEMTYDWIVFSSEEFKKEIRKAVASNENTELVWQNRFRISFDPRQRTRPVKHETIY